MQEQPQIFDLLSVGNELLIGKVVNTNLSWLGTKIASLGGVVEKCTVVRDDIDEIGLSLKNILDGRCGWVIITGGLGPTYDDKTLEAVAKALGRGLSVNEEAVAMLKERYVRLAATGVTQSFQLTPTRLKMATLPDGSNPLKNSSGSAPGVLIHEKEKRIVCLPGVPKELQAIFEEHLEPVIRKESGALYRKETEILVTGVTESTIAPQLEKIITAWPSVYVKSHPKGIIGGVSTLLIHIAATSKTESEAEQTISDARKIMSDFISEAGGVVGSVAVEPIAGLNRGEGREYPKRPFAAVSVLVVDSGKVLLVKRRFEPSQGKWTVPGGLIELGEAVRDAAVREIEEEVGLKVQLDRVLDVADSIVKDDKGSVRFHYVIVDFEAKPVGGMLLANSEAIDIGWFTYEEAAKLELTSTARKLLEKSSILPH